MPYVNIYPVIFSEDLAAFQDLYKMHQSKIYESALQWTRSVQAAREITQHAFVEIWKYRSQSSTALELEAYLHEVVNDRIIQYLKKEKNRRRILTTALKAETASASMRETHSSGNSSPNKSLGIKRLAKRILAMKKYPGVANRSQ